MVRAVRISTRDNVATLLDGCVEGDEIMVVGQGSQAVVRAREAISEGHKVALADMPEGAAVIKFSTRIGHATRPVPAGAWVHLHNLGSDYDERSQTLDVESGAPTDTVYQ